MVDFFYDDAFRDRILWRGLVYTLVEIPTEIVGFSILRVKTASFLCCMAARMRTVIEMVDRMPFSDSSSL
ncbi:hypothetical protein [Agrobacterium vitis]|uniref:Uncharacterized protein n=2 Tax=Agrobacterium vitis TaxID=373 RepID=A0AAE2UQD4_AGRVI|nr:hypothetical protein [Agrobacterium vitis]MBF2715307.1 hypothetical protein [Agrobacterium vitis]